MSENGVAHVFISYSSESDEHKARVLNLAQQLREFGVDAQIDLFLEGGPSEGWARWTQRQIEDSDFILVICTETYKRRFDGKERPNKGKGADWEGCLALQQLYNAGSVNRKLIPVLFDGAGDGDIPLPLQPFTHYRIPCDYDDLYRYISKQPRVVPKPLGQPRVVTSACASRGAIALHSLAATGAASIHGRILAPWTMDDLLHLLGRLWYYPTRGSVEASWAIKESALLKGDISTAFGEPGLGTALLTTEFAKRVFGEAARHRIEGCIQWGLAQTQADRPYYVLIKEIDPNTYGKKEVADFRHTIALGVILSRWRTHLAHRRHYLHEILRLQTDDGGWEAGASWPQTEVFTVLYAVEFLHMCADDADLPAFLQENAVKARDDGIRWLGARRATSGMWQSGVLDDETSDTLWTTSWVLDRLLSTFENEATAKIQAYVTAAIPPLLHCVLGLASSTIVGEHRRLLLETRVSSALHLALRTVRPEVDRLVTERAESFLNDFAMRAHAAFAGDALDHRDVATTVFLLKAIAGTGALLSAAKTTTTEIN